MQIVDGPWTQLDFALKPDIHTKDDTVEADPCSYGDTGRAKRNSKDDNANKNKSTLKDQDTMIGRNETKRIQLI